MGSPRGIYESDRTPLQVDTDGSGQIEFDEWAVMFGAAEPDPGARVCVCVYLCVDWAHRLHLGAGTGLICHSSATCLPCQARLTSSYRRPPHVLMLPISRHVPLRALCARKTDASQPEPARNAPRGARRTSAACCVPAFCVLHVVRWLLYVG